MLTLSVYGSLSNHSGSLSIDRLPFPAVARPEPSVAGAAGGRAGGRRAGRRAGGKAVCGASGLRRIWPAPRTARSAPAGRQRAREGRFGAPPRMVALKHGLRPPRSGSLWTCSACRQSRWYEILECGRGSACSRAYLAQNVACSGPGEV